MSATVEHGSHGHAHAGASGRPRGHDTQSGESGARPAGRGGHPGGSPYAPSPWVKTVISPRGQRATRIVTAIRLVSAFLTGVPLVLAALAIGAAYEGMPVPEWYWIVALVSACAAGIVVAYAHTYGARAALEEEKNIRARLLQRTFEAAFLPKNTDGTYTPARLIQLMSDNAERATEYRQRFSGMAHASLITPFVALGFVTLAFDPITGLIVMALCPLIPIALVAFMRFFRATSANSRRERARLSGKYLDAIRNLVTIRLLGAGERIENALREAGETNRKAVMKLLAGNQLVIVVVDGIFSLILIVVASLVTIWRYNAGALDVGQAIAIVFLMILLIEPLSQVAGFFYIGMGGKAALAAIGHYMQPSFPSSRGAQRRGDLPPVALAVHNMSYDYGRGCVLDNVNLELRRGDKVAIVGASGGGKSTLLSLVAGSLPRQSGTLTINGRDYTHAPATEIRAQSALVSQQTWMFTGTIADNLRIAAPDASEDEMWQALRRAHVADDIERMPDKLHTYIGEGAALISGGQAQRLSIARALLSGRKILLLDEPTSHVDIESEAHIIDALSELDEEWTVLVVTHRHSMLRAVTRIYTMAEGCLSEQEVRDV